MEAFVMIPYDGTFDNVLESAVKPAIIDTGLIPVVVREEVYIGPIYERIQASIDRSKLCLADVTGGNPNVMWEAAYAHASGIPVVFIAQGRPESIPFDVRHNRCIMYDSTSQSSLLTLKQEIEQSIRTVLAGQVSDLEAVRQIVLPNSLSGTTSQFVVAASSLSWRTVSSTTSGWRRQVETISDYVGIRGLMSAFGLILGMQGLPELVNPDDFDDEVLTRQMHLYMIGSSKANRWTQIMMKEFFNDRTKKWAFRPDPESENIRNPKVNIIYDDKVYSPLGWEETKRVRKDFGIVLRGPNPSYASQMITVLAGRGALGTEAASLAVTNPICVQKLLSALAFRGIKPEDHHQAFVAVISLECEGKEVDFKTAVDTFHVWDVVKCQ